MAISRGTDAADWQRPAAMYLVISAIGHLAWEAAHVRLYTIWTQANAAEIRFAVLHCTAGDVLIATTTAVAAWLLCGRPPARPRLLWRMAAWSGGLGVAYTMLSERLNVGLWQNWAYGPSMPLIPGTSVGLTPVLQWIVVPVAGFAAAHAALSGFCPRRH